MREKPQKEKVQAEKQPEIDRTKDKAPDGEGINAAHAEMLNWMKKVKFRKAMFGGVDESDVWRKLEELNNLYEAALLSERTRYDTLLQAYAKTANGRMNEYKKNMQSLQMEISDLEKQLKESDRK
ncbi:MAG: hypothetical protein Q4B26_15225 [Eubacteriales bacterium]|nr:hypothetical protein [Eubacteriales bacterium]